MQDVFPHNDSVLKAIQVCLDRNLNFAAYRLPGKSGFTLIIQLDPEMKEAGNSVLSFQEKGFLISPFSRSAGDSVYLIRPDLVFHDKVEPEQMDKLLSLPPVFVHPAGISFPEETGKEQYIQQIEEIVGRIKTAEFEKVMLSRIKSVMGSFSNRLAVIFNRLCHVYNHAFVYVFCVKGNCWTGATPEPFICSNNGELCTVSLAGTRPCDPENMFIGNWNRKELLEQEYVTRYIEQVLLAFSIRDYKKNGPFIARAGNLSHLRTDFTFSASSAGSLLPSLINALHPTPAVCGMESGKAMDYIRQTEKHSREYYTGFLGPIGIDDLMQLYVNLRCMKILDDRCVLYIGGGITQDSIPEDEWKETEIKADTLLSVLEQIR